MQDKTIDESNYVDEDLIDTLIAISVVAKRLAVKLREQNEVSENEQNE